MEQSLGAGLGGGLGHRDGVEVPGASTNHSKKKSMASALWEGSADVYMYVAEPSLWDEKMPWV